MDYESESYHSKRHPDFLHSKELMSAWSFFAWTCYLEPHKPNSLLEIGGAYGWNLIEALNQGVECDLVEPAKEGKNAAQKMGINSFESILEIKNKKYDLILIRHVLEHVPDPLELLSQIKLVSKPETIVLIVLPIEDPLRPVSKQDIDHHLFTWNPQALANLSNEAGFELDFWGQNRFTGKKIFLPLYRLGFKKTYVLFMKILGAVLRKREMVFLLRLKNNTDALL